MDDVGAVGLLRVVADLELAARGVIGAEAIATDPSHAFVCGDRRIGFVEATVDRRITGEGVGLGAVGEGIDVRGAISMGELEGRGNDWC